MTKLPQAILIVNNKAQMENHIAGGNEVYSEMANGFNLVDIDDLKRVNRQSLLKQIFRCKDTKIQVYSDKKLVPIEDYPKKGHLVQSEIYNNRYYPLFEYANSSYEELASVMALLAHFMGDNVKFEFEYYKVELKEFKRERNNGFWAVGKCEQEEQNIFEKLGGDITNITKTSEKNKIDMQFGTAVENLRKNPKELQKFIDNEMINIYALPDIFRTMLDTYLKSNNPNGKLKGYSSKEHTLKNVEKYTEICKKFALNVNIQEKFKAEFGIKIADESSSNSEIITKIRHSATFN